MSPRLSLSALRSLSLGSLLSDLRTIYRNAGHSFLGCEDPLCDEYGCPGPSPREEMLARLAASVTLRSKGLTPDVALALITARTSAKWVYESGTLALFSDLFPEAAS